MESWLTWAQDPSNVEAHWKNQKRSRLILLLFGDFGNHGAAVVALFSVSDILSLPNFSETNQGKAKNSHNAHRPVNRTAKDPPKRSPGKSRCKAVAQARYSRASKANHQHPFAATPGRIGSFTP